MLKIERLRVEVDGREILHGVDLEIKPGETHILFGPNGCGKTTLLMSMMGFSRYKITGGRILFNGQDVTYLSVHERARLGVGLMFQRPPAIPGLKTQDMVRISGLGKTQAVEPMADRLNMSTFLSRDINVGFSGGEIKRSELLQLMAQQPNLVLLDEPESGVDMENIVLLGQVIGELLEKGQRPFERKRSGLIITHTGFILDYVAADRGHVMCDGKMMCSGIPHELLSNIREHGYEECAVCRQ